MQVTEQVLSIAPLAPQVDVYWVVTERAAHVPVLGAAGQDAGRVPVQEAVPLPVQAYSLVIAALFLQ